MNIKKTKNKSMSFMPYIMLAIVIICAYFFLSSIGTIVNELDYSELTKEINEGNVTELTVTPRSGSGVYIITGKLKDYEKGETFSVTIPYTDTVISGIYESAESKGLSVETNTNPENSTWLSIFRLYVLVY